MKRTRLIFSFYFFCLILIPLCGQIDLARPEEGPSQDLVLQNFDISFSPTHNTDDHVEVDIGGKRLVDFRNLGVYEVGTGQVVFKALLTVEFSTNVYTDYWLEDAFSAYRINQFKLKYLKLTSDPNWLDSADRTTKTYYARGNEYLFEESTFVAGQIVTLPFGMSYTVPDSYTYTPATFLATGVDDTFNFGIQYVNFEEKYLQALNADTVLNDTLKVNKPVIQPVECRTARSSVQPLDEYQDLFVGTAEASVVGLELGTDGYTSQAGDAAGDVTTKIGELLLGVTSEPVQEITGINPLTNTPLQGGAIQHAPGKILTKAGDNNFTIQLTNRPQLTTYTQKLNTRYAAVDVDSQDGAVLKDACVRWSSAVENDDYIRTVGWRIDNFNLQTNFTVDFVCYSTVEMDPQDQSYYLGIPEFRKGDVIWDVSLFGTTGVSLVFTDPYDYLEQPGNEFIAWLQQYWWVVAIIAVGLGTFWMFKGQLEAAAWRKALTAK